MDKLWMDSLRLEAVAINKDIDEPAFFGAWHLTGSKMGRAEKMTALFGLGMPQWPIVFGRLKRHINS
jgi:hypothetical protein